MRVKSLSEVTGRETPLEYTTLYEREKLGQEDVSVVYWQN